jgi:FkbM family methyltransferase
VKRNQFLLKQEKHLEGIPSKSFLLRHKLIATLQNIDLKGVRRFSLALPKLLMPKTDTVSLHELKTKDGIYLLIDPAQDKGLERSLFENGHYELGTQQLLNQFLKKGSVFLDIGANIGLFTIQAAKIVGKSGKVIAFEANPKTQKILSHNLDLNHVEQVVTYGVALSDENGETTIYENWNVNRGGASLISQDNQEGISIQMVKLDALFETNEQVDLVKLDVEGWEGNVLRGGMNLFKAQNPIFIIEVSKVRENEKGIQPEEIVEIVKSIGDYQFFKQKSGKARTGKLVEILSNEDLPNHDNIICIPNRKI